MAVGFEPQHAIYALTLPGIGVYVAAFFVWGLGAGIVYARKRRLTSLIVAHFIINTSTAPIPLFVIYDLRGGG